MYVNGTGRDYYEFFIQLNRCGTLGENTHHQDSRKNPTVGCFKISGSDNILLLRWRAKSYVLNIREINPPPSSSSFFVISRAEKSHVEHRYRAVQSPYRGGVRRALQGHLRVRIRLLEDRDVSLSWRRVSFYFYFYFFGGIIDSNMLGGIIFDFITRGKISFYSFTTVVSWNFAENLLKVFSGAYK